MLNLVACALLTCEVFELVARPLNRALEAAEFGLLVIGSSLAATCRWGRSSVIISGIVKNESGWDVICCVTPSVNSFTCLRK